MERLTSFSPEYENANAQTVDVDWINVNDFSSVQYENAYSSICDTFDSALILNDDIRVFKNEYFPIFDIRAVCGIFMFDKLVHCEKHESIKWEIDVGRLTYFKE